MTTDWETNRSDWVTRLENTTSSNVKDQRKYQLHSFNIALFDEDIALGKRLYDITHAFWFKALKEGGSRHLIVHRKGGHYDVVPVNFPTPTVSKK